VGPHHGKADALVYLTRHILDRPLCRAVATQCRDEGVDAITVGGHIADDNACRQIAGTAAERFGRFDTLFNNAGVTPMRLLPSLAHAAFKGAINTMTRSARVVSTKRGRRR